MSQYSGNDNLQLHSAKGSWKTNGNLLLYSVWKTDTSSARALTAEIPMGVESSSSLRVWKWREMPSFACLNWNWGYKNSGFRQGHPPIDLSLLSIPCAYPGSGLHSAHLDSCNTIPTSLLSSNQTSIEFLVMMHEELGLKKKKRTRFSKIHPRMTILSQNFWSSPLNKAFIP